VIFEGVCGSGKTTLLRATQAALADREVSVFLQRATYAPIASREDDGTLDDASNTRALVDVVQQIRDEVSSQRLVLVDTLHPTQFVRAGALSVSSFVSVDRTLAALGALVIVLHVDIDTIRRRTIVERRGTGFARYAEKFGATEEDRVQYFVREQERLVDLLATHSCLPQILLDGSESTDVLLATVRRAM
jgi:thymidylate kinase